MQEFVPFETPENVRVTYQPAGLGTRFLAWFIDMLILGVIQFAILVVLIFSVASVDQQVSDWTRELLAKGEGNAEEKNLRVVYLVAGAMHLVGALCSFLYFSLSELVGRGQTVGKRWHKLRVVKANGFALDAASVFVRNFFRVFDHFSLFWLVPLFSARYQRLGDMASGTLVVHEPTRELSGLREVLLERSATDCRFRFEGANLAKLREVDQQAVEKTLERWRLLGKKHREALLGQMVAPLAQRMGVEAPALDDRVVFLEDLLTAVYRRQHRHLG